MLSIGFDVKTLVSTPEALLAAQQQISGPKAHLLRHYIDNDINCQLGLITVHQVMGDDIVALVSEQYKRCFIQWLEEVHRYFQAARFNGYFNHESLRQTNLPSLIITLLIKVDLTERYRGKTPPSQTSVVSRYRGLFRFGLLNDDESVLVKATILTYRGQCMMGGMFIPQPLSVSQYTFVKRK